MNKSFSSSFWLSLLSRLLLLFYWLSLDSECFAVSLSSSLALSSSPLASPLVSASSGVSSLWINEHTYTGNAPVCVDIPRNFSLCNDLEYQVMRLPNLFGHETLDEIWQQASGWMPLFQIGCHPNTKLFLCSLFTPVCLEQTIPPCRSLCESVKNSCEHHMLKHGYPWPRIVDCAQYPVDNDMCIKAQFQQANRQPSPNLFNRNDRLRSSVSSASSSAHSQSISNSNSPQLSSSSSSGGSVSASGHSYEAILNRFCMSNWTMRARAVLQWNSNDAYLNIQTFRMLYGTLPNKTIVMTNATTGEHLARFMPLKVPNTLVDSSALRRGSPTGIRKYLIIGQTLSDQRLKAILVTPYNIKLKTFRKAIRDIKEDDVDCDAEEIADVVTNFYSETLKLKKIKLEKKSFSTTSSLISNSDNGDASFGDSVL